MKDERMVRAFDAMTPNAEERQRMRRKLQQNLQAVGAQQPGDSRRAPYGVKKSVAVALAAAAVLLVSATALAATGFFGAVDWGGQRNDFPASTPSPTILPEIMDDLEAAVLEQLAAAPGDQIWSATLPDGRRIGEDLWESVSSLDMLRTRKFHLHGRRRFRRAMHCPKESCGFIILRMRRCACLAAPKRTARWLSGFHSTAHTTAASRGICSSTKMRRAMLCTFGRMRKTVGLRAISA